MTDWKALCEELSEALCGYEVTREDAALILRARAALAQPEPEAVGPTDEELFRIASDCAAHYIADDRDYDNCSEVMAAMRAVLARYGHQPTPVPVSERLPGPEDCDAEGRCWWWRTDDADEWWELLCISDAREYNAGCGNARYTHWLPATVLPLPAGEVQP